jgi:hypothetical protein
VGAQQRARRGAAEQQRHHAQRNRQMTGAEDECPYHPRHAPILQVSWIRDLARRHPLCALRAHEHEADDQYRHDTDASEDHEVLLEVTAF